MEGCHYAGQAESIHCYCSGDKCNNKLSMEFYVPKLLPSVECCECSESHGDECLEKNCKRTCKGNYCLIDFDGVEQVSILIQFFLLHHFFSRVVDLVFQDFNHL